MTNPSSEKDTFIALIETYFRKIHWFIISLFICFSCVFIYLRYSTNLYNIKASIKIANGDDSKNSILSEVNTINDYGLFKKDFNSVYDEIEVLKSKSITNSFVNSLNLNVKYLIKGNIKSLELYKNPPITVNFLDEDSILHHTDTTITLHVISKNQFTFQGENTLLNFGDKIPTPIGDLIITPNFSQPEMSVGKDIMVKISSLENTTNQYAQKLKIAPAGENSSVVIISIDETIKEKGEDIVNTLIKEYNDYVIENKKQVVDLTSDFINNRLQVIADELSQVDLTAENVKKDNKLTDLASQSSIFLQSERDIESQQVTTATQLKLVDYMSDYLKDNTNSSDLIPANLSFEDNSINELTQQHNNLVIQRNRLLKASSNKNPVVENLNTQIESLKQSINQSLSNAKSSSQIRLNALKREDNRISSQIYSAPKKERQFRDIQRQQSIKESLYLYLLEKREESAITHGIKNPNAIIIDPAYSNSSPVWPQKSILFLAALVFGILIPLTLIYILNLLDTKIRTKADVLAVLNIPFLGDIPKANTKSKLVKQVDYSPKAEAFRIIRSNIDFMLKSHKSACKTIFITSTIAQEGKSHTSVNLASSFSFSGKKTLLIETDIRVPKVSTYLNTKQNLGLTDYISNPELTIENIINQHEDNTNLSVIQSGTIPPNPAELLMSERVKTLFDHVKNTYDYIIVDTAAVGLVTDTLLISDFADLFIYVISANKIDKRQLHIAQTLHEEQRLPNMTSLLNGTITKKGYGYGYGSEPKTKKWW
ncbi:GumC family protein [Lacinutrix undariae]